MPEYIDLHHYTIGSGFPFVMLHGWSGDGLTYLFQIPFAYRYRLILPDLRCHGRSPKPRTGGDVKLMAGDLNRLFDTIGMEKAIVSGGSMGGTVALQFVLDYPERVEALILADTMSSGKAIPKELFENLLSSLQKADGIKQTLEEIYLGPNSSSTPQMEAWVKSRIERASELETEPLTKVTRALYEFDVTERLSEIRVPTLIIEAKQDALASESLEMHRRIGGSKLAEIDCGHGSPFFRPDLWNAAVGEFLRSIGH